MAEQYKTEHSAYNIELRKLQDNEEVWEKVLQAKKEKKKSKEKRAKKAVSITYITSLTN